MTRPKDDRTRVYLQPAHMDVHGGRHGFYVERFLDGFSLGWYEKILGGRREHAVAIDRHAFEALKAQAKANFRRFGPTCKDNPACPGRKAEQEREG